MSLTLSQTLTVVVGLLFIGGIGFFFGVWIGKFSYLISDLQRLGIEIDPEYLFNDELEYEYPDDEIEQLRESFGEVSTNSEAETVDIEEIAELLDTTEEHAGYIAQEASTHPRYTFDLNTQTLYRVASAGDSE